MRQPTSFPFKKYSRITAITNCSGHYQPSEEIFTQTIALLKKAKVVQGDPLERCYFKDMKTGEDRNCQKAVFWYDSVTKNTGKCTQPLQTGKKDDLRR